MQKQFITTPFALAKESLAQALPQKLTGDEDEFVKIKLPPFRYDEIHDAVFHMYEKSNAQFFPLSIDDITKNLGYSLIPYRSLGSIASNAFLLSSPDAITIQAFQSNRPMIFFNDRQPDKRINFSIMHEIGHIELGHKEPSKLAEFEANHFAAVALCPIAFLEHHKLSNPKEISTIFDISEECAKNRLNALNNSRIIYLSDKERSFNELVIKRFRFKIPIQHNLYD